ncbi:MAG TPA: DUF2851 family protein [Bacteroidales bacterium]|nr:DUF2851 family protein [Bacteroidales bacterium]
MQQRIPESFFHFIWKYQLLSQGLFTTEKEPLTILSPGSHNHDAGPDFLLARIRIGSTIWVGNIEIHVKASDWYRHGHHQDPAYNNVVLHVVEDDNMPCSNEAGRRLPVLSIAGKFNERLLDRYREISNNLHWVPCMHLLDEVKDIHKLATIHAHAVGRLKKKAGEVDLELRLSAMDWDECCYRLIAKQFGSRVNVNNFEMLARSVPARVLMKYHNDLFRLESILFGQSGLIGSHLREKYPRELRKEHSFLAALHRLSPMPGYLWNFLRLRPASFPTIRIAHLARLYATHQRLFQSIIECRRVRELESIFSICASNYWNDHYLFGKKSKPQSKCFGKQGIHLLLINSIIPMIYHYGDIMHRQDLCDRAVSFLEQLPAEDNAVIRRWKALGSDPGNSLETQGLLELKKSACDIKACLNCSIGLQILKNGP